MTISILVGDVREKLLTLPADSFDCVVTSPPYWGLRDYGTGRWEGGDPTCEHRSPTMREDRDEDRASQAGSVATNSHQLKLAHRSACGKCGAIKVDQQIGLEPTLAEHLRVMVEVLREVRRVLKPSGTVWLNYGDCYATSPNGRSAADTKTAGNDDRTFRDKPFSTVGSGALGGDIFARTFGEVVNAVKAKDLCLIPNLLAIALRADGWWVRSENVWGKSNPMPESIKDRPGTSHEKIWMLTKSARYFYAADEVRQGEAPDVPVIFKTPDGWDTTVGEGGHGSIAKPGRFKGQTVAQKREGKQAAIAASAEAVGASSGRRMNGFNERWDEKEKLRASETGQRHAGHINHTGIEDTPRGSRGLRNYEPAPLSVWVMGTAPFSEAHFATFPPELVERCLKAGCPKGGTVLDPFGGAGTTALVADQMQLDATIIELNPDYVHIAVRRLENNRGAIQSTLDPLQVDLFAGAA